MLLNYYIKYILLFIFFLNSIIKNGDYSLYERSDKFSKFGQYSLTSLANNITNIPEIYLSITDISFTYSKVYNSIEFIYCINIYDLNFHSIKPSNLPLLYNLGIFCNYYAFQTNENIYSFANIYENQYFYCIEYLKIGEHGKFGIKISKIKEIGEEIEFNELFFFTDKIININKGPAIQNNYKFNFNHINKNYIQLIKKINEHKNENEPLKESYNLLYSYLQPPLCFLKKDIACVEGKWYFKNIYENYFCFCKGESCINLKNFYSNNFQSCKYYFYSTIIENNKYLYPKTHYLLSDFFDENIEASDAFPIFLKMIKEELKAHYITMSWNLYNKFCFKNRKCLKNLQMIYGIRKIDGNTLEKYLELFLKLKTVITAEKYNDIDNFFYNADYIVYIFLGHGVQYIKSYLYNDYLSPKRYNKMLLPPSKRIISVALAAGWKNENIIKISCPKFDNYKIYKKNTFSLNNSDKNERSIFIMFTWRQVRYGNNISDLYYDNLYKILNDTNINELLNLNNIKLFFCYHHALKEKKIINLKDNNNIIYISQHEISLLLRNSSLIITDFSAILFDAIVQRKPLILFIPDGLDPNLKNIYTKEYYEIINNIINGVINLNEVFIDIDKVIDKIIYYINNDFVLEKEKLNFYKLFRLTNRGNTRKFINYIKKLK